MSTLTIGKLARGAGVRADTVRYYERLGLIAEPPRRPSGYREYPAEALHRLRLIQRLRALGFSMRDVRELLELREPPGLPPAAGALVQARIDAVDRKIAELQRLRAHLQAFAEGRDEAAESEAVEAEAPVAR